MAKGVALFEGEEVAISELARRFKQPRRTVNERLRKGWSLNEALNPNTRFTERHGITFNGKTMTLKEWANELGICENTLYGRLHRRKWSVKKAFTHKVEHGGARTRILWKGKLRGSLSIPTKYLTTICEDLNRGWWEFMEGDERLVVTSAHGFLNFEYNPED